MEWRIVCADMSELELWDRPVVVATPEHFDATMAAQAVRFTWSSLLGFVSDDSRARRPVEANCLSSSRERYLLRAKATHTHHHETAGAEDVYAHRWTRRVGNRGVRTVWRRNQCSGLP